MEVDFINPKWRNTMPEEDKKTDPAEDTQDAAEPSKYSEDVQAVVDGIEAIYGSEDDPGDKLDKLVLIQSIIGGKVGAANAEMQEARDAAQSAK